MSAPRVMIRQLREVMAKPEAPQMRLDKIVKLIAGNMVAEVSSIYVCGEDGSLELFATEGLKQEAVHKTKLKRGEGLVGQIAGRGQPINLPEAQTHPAFSYRPETGEEIYHSFLGVPILRGGRTLGVLTVQNATERQYSEEEVEAMQTTAMVLAEMLASGRLTGSTGAAEAKRSVAETITVSKLCEGIALGHVVFHEPRVIITRMTSDDPKRETVRLDDSVRQLRANIDKLLEGEGGRTGEHREILETYRMFAYDTGWLRKMAEAVNCGLTAEAAVERVQMNMRVQLMEAGKYNSFWRERMADLDDLANRLLRILSGKNETSAHEDLPSDTILVARTMGAAELLDYNKTRLKGVILEEGGQTSHVAIVARSLGIAAAGNAKDILSMLEPGNPVVLDAEAGQLHIRPSLEVIRNYADKARFRAKRQEQYQRLRNVPAVTQDGQRIMLLMNAGLAVDLPHLRQSGADGIGLFRTELQFMISSTYPKRDQQTATYKEVLDAADGKPVTFRSLDVGGDKILPYMRHVREENPALGWRAIRVSLDRPGLFRTQIRALLKAAPERELRIMLPFIAHTGEFRSAKAMILKELERMRNLHETPPARVLIGTMIEVPSLLYQLDELFRLVDFASVGSNDLFQFFFAADRENGLVSERFDSLSAPALKMLRSIVEAAGRREVPLTLCGEMAGKPLEAMALIGLGFRSISMAPASLGPVKAMLLSVNSRHLQEQLLEMIDHDEPEIRRLLLEYAEANGVNLPATAGFDPTGLPVAKVAP